MGSGRLDLAEASGEPVHVSIASSKGLVKTGWVNLRAAADPTLCRRQ